MRIPLVSLSLFFALAVVVGCGEDVYQDNQGQTAAGGPATGILLNCQLPNSTETLVLQGQQTKSWSVVDPSGNVIFQSSDVTGSNGTYVARKRSEASTKGLWLGKNPKEFGIEKAEITQDGDARTVKLIVSDATAADMRATGNLMDLVHHANLVLLVGRLGD